MTGKRPNILFASADDWGRHAGACRQNKYVDSAPRKR